MTGIVVWITGLPSSGKTTLAARVRARVPGAILLDSDDVRALLHPPPGYDERGREDFYATLGALAVHLATQGHLVLVAATANRRRHRAVARAGAPRFVEVHVTTDAETCAARDPKGLWAAARAGRASSLPGAGEAYEPPAAPEVIARGGFDEQAVEAIVERLLLH